MCLFPKEVRIFFFESIRLLHLSDRLAGQKGLSGEETKDPFTVYLWLVLAVCHLSHSAVPEQSEVGCPLAGILPREWCAPWEASDHTRLLACAERI